MNIGIDHIAFYTPGDFLPLEALAKARGVDPLKYTVGIGIREAAVAGPAEDVVVLAANAGARVLEEAGVAPSDIGMLVVGTESAVDKSKPTATHVHQLLGIGSRCRVYDVVHACVGATYALLSAIDWLQNPANRYALIIASDIARYGKGSLGEPTQGAGAVAMLISRSPRLLSLTEAGAYSKSVYDFWKPLDGHYPLVDGIFSAQCYGEAAESCFRSVELKPEAAFLYHVPYPKLVQQTHTRVVRLLSGTIDIDEHFRTKVADSCVYPARVGNIYTGSLWLALMSFLEIAYRRDPSGELLSKEFDGCYLFSYGAGCGAELLRGEWSPDWARQAALFNLEALLGARRALSLAEYEETIAAYENPSGVPKDRLSHWPVAGRFRYLGTEGQKRFYGSATTAKVVSAL